jgi:hypothetical protein
MLSFANDFEATTTPTCILLPLESPSRPIRITFSAKGYLQSKNRTLTMLLREARTEDLQALVELAERAILDSNHQAETLKDRAHGRIELGGPGADLLRELSFAYKERIEVLKPVLAAIRDEMENRRK